MIPGRGPAQVGPYALDGELGRGGMGVVFRARDPAGRPVALKLLLGARPAQSDAARARFAREARLQAGLGEEAGFVPCLDAGEAPQGPWLVMPLLPGGTLRDRLARGPLAVDDALDLAVALGRALGRAHAAGVVHRDLKPENVLFTGDGRPLVADLGLAKQFAGGAPGAGLSVALSRTGELRGTAGYMAPEQARDAKSVAPPADVFALGALTYECLTGAPAFAGDSPIQVLAAVISGDVTPVRDLRPDVPAAVARAVERALALAPGDRPADGAAFARALEAARAEADEGAARARTPRPRAALGALLVLGVATLGAVALGAALAARPPSPPSGGSTAAGDAGPAGATTSPPVPAEVSRAAPPRRGPALRLEATFGGERGKHDEAVTAVAATSDGRLVTACTDGHVRVWDAEGAATLVLGPAPAQPHALALGPDGRWALTGGLDGAVLRWDLEPGARPARVAALPGPVRVVAVSDDGALGVALGGQHLATFDPTRDLEGGDAPTVHRLDREVTSAVFAPGAARELVVAGDFRPAFLRLEAGGPAPSRELEAGRPGAVLHRAGVTLVAGGADGWVSLWDLERERSRGSSQRSPSPVRAVAAGPRGALAAGGADGSVTAWDGLGRRARVAAAHGAGVSGLAFLPDGRLATVGGDFTLRLWAQEGEALRPVWVDPGHGGFVTGLGLGPGGALVSAAGDGQVLVRRPDTGAVVHRLLGHGRFVNALALSPDGRRAVTVAHDATPRVWDLESGALAHRLEGGHRNNVLAALVLPDGRRAVTGCDEPALVLWDIERGQPLSALRGGPHAPAGWVQGLASSDDGAALWAISSGGTLQGYEPATWRERARVRAHEVHGTHGLDGRAGPRQALTFGDDGRLALWDLRKVRADAEPRASVAGGGPIDGAALLDDARALACERGGDLVLWDLHAVRPLVRLPLDGGRGDAPRRVLVAPVEGRGARRTIWVGTRRGLVHRVALEE